MTRRIKKQKPTITSGARSVVSSNESLSSSSVLEYSSDSSVLQGDEALASSAKVAKLEVCA